MRYHSNVANAAPTGRWVLLWWFMAVVARVDAFQTPLSSSSSRSLLLVPRLWAGSSSTSTTEEGDVTTTTMKEEKLSDMDARVLRSMLQDSDKLDLKTEENLKKLLERGVVSKQVPQDAQQEAQKKKKKKRLSNYDDDSEFSSQVLQTLSDTKLWKALSRKAGDWLESATLFVVNRVERDAMTLAALGLFAWERAVRDVGRALPAAGASSASASDNNDSSKTKKRPLLLSAKSSGTRSIVEDMTTPMDELKSVGSAVADILKTGSNDNNNYYSNGGSRSTGTFKLRTAATSRRDKRNFRRSYQRSQQKAAQNSPDPVRATQRITSGVVDTAWQLKRELQVEKNVPGYKSKQVQTVLEAATDSTKQLFLGAQETWKLERAKQRERKEQRMLQQQQEGTVTDLEVLNEEKTSLLDETTTPSTSPSSSSDSYVVGDVETAFFASSVTPDKKSQMIDQQQQKEPAPSQKRMEEARRRSEQQQAERLQQQELRIQQQREQQEQLRKQCQEQLEEELWEECLRLKEQLQNCIVNPEQTWLRSDIIEGVRNFDQTLIRQVVTEMIATRNSLKDLIRSIKELETMDSRQKIGLMLDELISVQGMIEEIQEHAQQAVSLGAARALKQELLEHSVSTSTTKEDRVINNNKSGIDNLIPVLLRLDQLQHQLETLDDVIFIPEQKYTDALSKDASSETQTIIGVEYDFQTSNAAFVEEDTLPTVGEPPLSSDDANNNGSAFSFVDVIPEAFVYAVATTPATTTGVGKTQPAEVGSNTAELVTDDDFEAAVGETKRAVAAEYDEDDNAVDSAKAKDDNLILILLLRSLDVLFFLLEKTVTVALPTVVSSSVTAKDRLDNVAQGGLGSKGWKRIGSAQEGARRY